jgi:hypothetical protein
MKIKILEVSLAFAVLFGFGALAAPTLTASCQGCVQTEQVLSVPLGAEVLFQVSDAQTPPREAIWVFSDGGKAYGLAAKYTFLTPGKHTVEVLAIYGTDTVPQSATLTVHVVVAPSIQKPGTFFGLPNEITYPILAALAMYIVTYINALIGR